MTKTLEQEFPEKAKGFDARIDKIAGNMLDDDYRKLVAVIVVGLLLVLVVQFLLGLKSPFSGNEVGADPAGTVMPAGSSRGT